MAKYTEKLAKEIVKFIEQDIYTISEICNMFRINRKTFYEWKKTKPEFNHEVESALERREEVLVVIARSSLKKKLEGYTLTEIKETYEPSKGNPAHLILKSRVEKKKEYAPDNRCIQMVLERNEKKEEQKRLKEQELQEKKAQEKPEETKEQRLIRLMAQMNPKTEEHRRIVIEFNERIEQDKEEYLKKQQEQGLIPQNNRSFPEPYMVG